MRKFKIEMLVGQDQRMIEADSWCPSEGWLIFYRLPAEGGRAVEYWRVREEHVVSMETGR